MQDTMDRIRSGLLGNTEAIEDLGINVNIAMIESTKAFKKFAGDKSWRQLDFQTQQQIRLMAILEQSVDKYGTEINQNTSTSLQKLNSILDDTKLKLGQAFLPIIEIAVPALINLAEKASMAAEAFKIASEFIFGKNQENIKGVKSNKDLADSQDDVTNAMKKSNQEAKKSLAPFDEITTLQEKIAKANEEVSKSTTTPEGKQQETDTTGVKESVKDAIMWQDKLREKLAEIKKDMTTPDPDPDIFEQMINSVQETVERLPDIFSPQAFTELGDNIWEGLRAPFVDFQHWLNNNDIWKGFVENVNEVFGNPDFFPNIWQSFVNKTNEVFGGESAVFQTISNMWGRVTEKTSEGLGNINNRISKSIEDITNLNWSDITHAVEKLWIEARTKTNNWLWSIWQRVKMSVSDIAEKSGWNSIWEAVKVMWDNVKDTTANIWRSIRLTVSKSAKAIIDIINKVIDIAQQVRFTVPNVPLIFGSLAGKSFGINISNIDTSGIESTIASIEQEATVITPQQQQALEAGAGILSEQGANDRTVNIFLDGLLLGRGLLPYMDDERERIGEAIFE